MLGLKTTLKYLFGRSVTIQYPKQRWQMPERSRGIVVLLSDLKTGELNCTACLLCQRACPVAAITITQAKNPQTKKRYPKTFEVNILICCFCGLCEEVCNFDAIKMTGKYEFATFDKQSLIFDIEKLQEIGRDVKYERKRKPRKPAAKPQGAVKAETKPESSTIESKESDVVDRAKDNPDEPRSQENKQ